MIVNRVSQVMGARRVSMAEVSRRTGLAYSTVHDIYHGRAKRIELDTIDKLCEALDATVAELLLYMPNKRPARQQEDGE